MVYEDNAKGKETVLIVDDVESNRLILNEIIESMGCYPCLAENGREALELIQKLSPQLILTDISMPVMNGYELCRIIKGNETTKDIPIVFISAFDNPQAIVEGLTYGGEDYITKPFVAEVIRARVGVHLRLNEARRELVEMNRRLSASVNEQLQQMESEKRNILYALADIASEHSGHTGDYVKRLQHNSRILAQGMQLSPVFEDKISDTFIDTVEMAVPLCDIGNIGIPREILQSGAEWNEEETAIMQRHTEIGAKFLKDLHVNSDYNDFIGVSADIIRHHHENWDGSGYPDGLSKDEIPLAAQIVSIMERYSALTENADCTREEALAILKKESGVKINPDIFGICFKISRQLC